MFVIHTLPNFFLTRSKFAIGAIKQKNFDMSSHNDCLQRFGEIIRICWTYLILYQREKSEKFQALFTQIIKEWIGKEEPDFLTKFIAYFVFQWIYLWTLENISMKNELQKQFSLRPAHCCQLSWHQWSYYRMAKIKSAESP